MKTDSATINDILSQADDLKIGVSITRDTASWAHNGLCWSAQFHVDRDGVNLRVCKIETSAEAAIISAWAAFEHALGGGLKTAVLKPPVEAKALVAPMSSLNNDIPF